MARIDLRTLPLSEQHHPLAFNSLGHTGRSATDFLWICPQCNDNVTHAPMSWTGGKGYFHVAENGSEFDARDEAMHQLVAVDVIAVLESWRQIWCHLKNGTSVCCFDFDDLLKVGAPMDDEPARGV